MFEDQKVFDVVVQGNPDIAKNPDAVRNLLIDRPDGGHVRLSDIADIREGTSPTVIQRDEVSRKLDITMDVDGRNLEDVSEEIEEKLQDVEMPLEYHAKVIDKSLAEEIDRGQSIAFGLAAALAVLLLMQAAVRSWRLAGLAYLAVPSALLGGVVALLLLGDGLTIATGAGLLAVFVLAVRNTLTSLDRGHPRRRRLRRCAGPVHPGGDEQSRDRGDHAAVRGPGSGIGLEILQPMAIVVLGGLVTTVLHALLVLPALSAAFPAPEPDPDEEILDPVRAESTTEGITMSAAA